jgi:hypothetical protein
MRMPFLPRGKAKATARLDAAPPRRKSFFSLYGF